MALNGNDGDRKTPTEAEVYSQPGKQPTAEDLEWRKRDVTHLPWEMQLLFRAVREMDATARERWNDALPRLQGHSAQTDLLRGELAALTATVKARFDELEQHTLERVARVEGATRAAAEATDANVKKLEGRLNEAIGVVNKAHPEVPDIADVTGVHSIERVVKHELLQAKFDSAHDKLKKLEERREWLSRQVLLWVAGGSGAVALMLLSALLTLVLKRFL